MNRVLEIKMLNELCHIGGIGVHVVTKECLCRASMASTVVSDHPEAVFEKEHHLTIPVVRAERPAVVKEERLRVFRTPVFEEDCCPVFNYKSFHGFLLVEVG